MAANSKTLWRRLSRLYSSSEEEASAGKALFREYTHRGYLQLSDEETEALSAGVIIDFYRRLSLLRSASSPVGRRRDARWMISCDFQQFQVRKYGSFFKALFDLPRIRPDSLVLMPVTKASEEVSLYPESHSLIDPVLRDPLLDSLGFSLEDQFRLFLAAVHLNGKKAGYYLSPLISPVSAVIYRKPEFFLWKKHGTPGAGEDDCTGEVRQLVEREFRSAGKYDYTNLRRLTAGAGLEPVSAGPEGIYPCFNLKRSECREYFSGIYSNLQSQYALDFGFLSFPGDMVDAEGLETVGILTEEGRGSLKKYTGWIVDSPDPAQESLCRDLPVQFSLRETDAPVLSEQFIHSWFHSLGELFDINRGRKVPFSRTVLLKSQKHQRDDLFARMHFLARFSGISRFRRPLLLETEPSGNGSGGSSETYNLIEDVYTRYRTVLEKGRLIQVVADESFAWWIISDRGRILIPLLALDHRGSGDAVRIDYNDVAGKGKVLSVVEYDFTSSQGSLYLSADNSLTVTDLEPGTFRLFSLQ